MKKKLLTGLLSVAFILTSGFALASCEDDLQPTKGLQYEKIEGKEEYRVVGMGASKTKTLVIPATYEGLPVTEVGEDAFRFEVKLKTIVIPDSVITIHDSAFRECDDLEQLTIGKSVTTIGDYAFAFEANLKKIVIPDSVITIGESAFATCDDVTSLKIGKNVESIGEGTFSVCKKLKSVTLPDSLVSIEDDLFYNCQSLTTVKIGNSVASIGKSAFEECRKLANVNIPESVEVIEESAFKYCNIKNLTLPEGLKRIEKSAFYNGIASENLTIPDSVTDVEKEAFFGCDFESLTIGKGLTEIKPSAFDTCLSLRELSIGPNVKTIGDYAFQNAWFLTNLVIPEGVTAIGGCAFRGNESLISLTLPKSLLSIGSNAFDSCYKLLEVINRSPHITVEKGSQENGKAGYYATDVYNGDGEYTSKLSTENGCVMYSNGEEKILVHCGGTVEKLIIPSDVTAIRRFTFRYSYSLKNLVIPESVVRIESNSGLNYCRHLSSVTFENPNGWSISNGKDTIELTKEFMENTAGYRLSQDDFDHYTWKRKE